VVSVPEWEYFTRPILIRCNIYTVMFKFNLIKSRVRIRLGLELGFFAYVFYGIHYRGVHGNGIPRGNGIPMGFPWEWE